MEPTPYEQFSPEEQPTTSDGWATLTMTRLQLLPVSSGQQPLVVFLRARKNSEDLLGGVSTAGSFRSRSNSDLTGCGEAERGLPAVRT